mmetsp:Transcript_10338/g.29480  ORF Transcript_10338/g.29480 Transcript_10338/m.29480 type:complete len:81 (-) Transcript_10338:573-815(-)|eukprot:CAMPEP_0117649228 /NCGR_PEP_ID=MMETSP0804-20121206/854_1 /TAXON_ID=1074897 /ORGANISM="Tetraselmis astigmatica, Strain CCMP880" /LENGTH=80 /DNA_ID=CAMNT_0005454939 /DNA_START=522 /DNA_END=764 /DNA_ORIENTATION=-
MPIREVQKVQLSAFSVSAQAERESSRAQWSLLAGRGSEGTTWLLLALHLATPLLPYDARKGIGQQREWRFEGELDTLGTT